VRRIERLINLIAALLDTERPMSAEDIRQKIAGYDQPNHDAFRRSFERDKDALRTMGIPLEVRPLVPAAPGVDGYIIPKDKYYLPDLDLDPDELAALKLTASAVLGDHDLAESGLMKLSVDAPSWEFNGPRIVWGADVAVEQPLLGELYGALLERTPVHFSYETADGTSSKRTVETYGLVHRAGHWYLVGREMSQDAVRSFKVSRITGDVRSEGGRYEIPAGFDAAARLAGDPWEMGEDTEPVTIRFDASLAWWAEQNLAGHGPAASPDGGRQVTMNVANLDALISWVIGFGDRVEIVDPPEARARLVAHLGPFLKEA